MMQIWEMLLIKSGDILDTEWVQAVLQKDWNGLKYQKNKSSGMEFHSTKFKVSSFQDE